jgi:hypothetical protein
MDELEFEKFELDENVNEEDTINYCNSGVICDMVKNALEKDPIPKIIY